MCSIRFRRKYHQRRKVIHDLNAEQDIEILDGAEVNYDPAYESKIMDFLKEADFDYVIGSVHYANEYDFYSAKQMADYSLEQKQQAIETYVNWQRKYIQPGLFDIIGHLDLPQRKLLYSRSNERSTL